MKRASVLDVLSLALSFINVQFRPAQGDILPMLLGYIRNFLLGVLSIQQAAFKVELDCASVTAAW